jgi:hypothetical protein
MAYLVGTAIPVYEELMQFRLGISAVTRITSPAA